MNVVVTVGDVLDASADVLISTANPWLSMSGGVNGAIPTSNPNFAHTSNPSVNPRFPPHRSFALPPVLCRFPTSSTRLPSTRSTIHRTRSSLTHLRLLSVSRVLSAQHPLPCRRSRLGRPNDD